MSKEGRKMFTLQVTHNNEILVIDPYYFYHKISLLAQKKAKSPVIYKLMAQAFVGCALYSPIKNAAQTDN